MVLASLTQVGSSYQQSATKTNNNSENDAINKKLSSAISLILEDINLTEIFASTSSKLYKKILFKPYYFFIDSNMKIKEQ